MNEIISPLSSIVEFVQVSDRYDLTVFELAKELETLGRHGAEWPRCTAKQWEKLARVALQSRLIRLDESGFVRMPVWSCPECGHTTESKDHPCDDCVQAEARHVSELLQGRLFE